MIQFHVGADGIIPALCYQGNTECVPKRNVAPRRHRPACALATVMAFVFLVVLVTWQSMVDFGKDAGEKIVEVGKELGHEVINEMPEAVELGEHAHAMVRNMGGVKNVARYAAIAVVRFR